jgi:FG-GAP repeat
MKTHLSILTLLLATISAHAGATVLPPTPDLAETKLMGRWPATLNPSSYGQGESTALSDKWALVGAAFADDHGGITNNGAVHVFNAATGAWVRLLRPPVPVTTNENFGYSLAINGDLAAVGALGYAGQRGAVFVFNVATGALVRTILASDGLAGDRFGHRIAISGGRLLVGAYSTNSHQGSAYLYDLATGMQLQKFKGSDSVAGDYFGSAVAMDGNLAVIGALGRSALRGAVYVIDLTTYAELTIIVPTLSAAGDQVGESVALSQGVVVMGAAYRNANTGAIFTKDLRSNVEHLLLASDGATNDYLGKFGVSVSAGVILGGTPFNAGSAGVAYLFDLHSGVQLRVIDPIDSGPGKGFGSAVAMWGNTALIGSRGDSLPLFPKIGSAYLIKPLMTTMPLTKVAARADTAPGLPETTLGTINDAFTNAEGEVAFTAKLTGAASHGNTDVGMWTSLQSSGTLSLSAATNRIFGYPGQVLSLGTPVLNQAAFSLYPVSFKVGIGGVTATTNKALYLSGPSTTIGFFSGIGMAVFGGSQVASFIEPVQTFTASFNRFATTCTLRLDASTTASTDSALFLYDAGNGTSDGLREGAAIVAGDPFKLGQFTGRVSYLRNSVVISAATNGPVANNAVIVQKSFNTAQTLIAKKGLPAPGAGGAAFSAFIGETTSPVENVLYRATLSGSPAASNEGLWTSSAGLLLRKGTPSTMLPAGLSIAKFINYWGLGQGSDLTFALVQLSGPGVSSVNDQAIILIQENGSSNLLMREGQSAPGCNPATIGVINRIDVDPWTGTYAIITTLAGAPAGTELAMFTGVARVVGNDTTLAALRRPVLYLRKGQRYHNQPSKIKSFSLPTTNLTASGAGGTGRGRAISWKRDFVITIEFDNKVRQIMKGKL